MAYLVLLTRLPPEGRKSISDLPAIPRRIVRAHRGRRNLAIFACFTLGGILIYLTAEPFLGSMLAVATAAGIPAFAVVQWFAPVISEFPELASTFYFARQEGKAPVAIMNIASSNINQWTLLVAMLPVVFSMGLGTITGFALDSEQQRELLLTIAQSLASLFLLVNMEFAWWEALPMFVLFASQFILPVFLGSAGRHWVTAAFFAWSAIECVRIAAQRRMPPAFASFLETWRAHVAS